MGGCGKVGWGGGDELVGGCGLVWSCLVLLRWFCLAVLAWACLALLGFAWLRLASLFLHAAAWACLAGIAKLCRALPGSACLILAKNLFGFAALPGVARFCVGGFAAVHCPAIPRQRDVRENFLHQWQHAKELNALRRRRAKENFLSQRQNAKAIFLNAFPNRATLPPLR